MDREKLFLFFLRIEDAVLGGERLTHDSVILVGDLIGSVGDSLDGDVGLDSVITCVFDTERRMECQLVDVVGFGDGVAAWLARVFAAIKVESKY